MVELLLNSPAFPMCLTRIIRSDIMQDFDFEFDLYLHWDLAFVENITKHLSWSTQKTNWDGVALCVGNNKVTPVLIEFSGGAKHNSSQAKEDKDTQKLYSNITQVINSIDVRIQENVLFVVRFVNLTTFFKSTASINGVMVKKTNCVVKCPTTASKMKGFAVVLPSLFNWKFGGIETAKKFK